MPVVPDVQEPIGASAHIIETSQNLQCVAYARRIGAIQIYGDAWTWWDTAKGIYSRGAIPQVGAVLVLGKKGASLGHVAVVRQIVNERIVITEHANWLNRGEIEMNSPIMDVSPDNDWSAVRVWYVPNATWGGSVYPAYGFIYPERMASL
jgi:surface antigen